ncbi:MAG TPA: sigma-70 family RNA polymerase sigma factor [Gemmatales bacterium]|nr:sigma-70 family RNA polymerase sigma factor [Gemmatales bacterium]HMP17807.1 sigma-70 family RNA polymerase sigma factor [Gemmatales bacterium]
MTTTHPALNSDGSRTRVPAKNSQNRELLTNADRPTLSTAEGEEQLLQAVQRGSLDAFSLLVHRYQDRLFNALTRFLDNQEDARDVLQEALLSAFSHARNFKGQSRFYTWIYRIAMNHAIDLLRRRKPRQTLSLHREDHPARHTASKEAGPTENLERSEDCLLIRSALQELSSEHRLVIVMKELDDMRYEEIAEVLEVPVGTVRSRLHRARAELKSILEKVAPQAE